MLSVPNSRFRCGLRVEQTYKSKWSTNAPKGAKQLTVECIADKVGLLGIWCVLWPALSPGFKYFVRDGTFGVILQPRASL